MRRGKAIRPKRPALQLGSPETGLAFRTDGAAAGGAGGRSGPAPLDLVPRLQPSRPGIRARVVHFRRASSMSGLHRGRAGLRSSIFAFVLLAATAASWPRVSSSAESPSSGSPGPQGSQVLVTASRQTESLDEV